MNPDRAVFIVCLCIAAFWGGMEVAQAESDEAKWARIAKAREARVIIERRYEACVTTCREGCLK